MKSVIKSFIWAPIISYILFFILLEFGHIELSIDWIKDYRVWINEYVITFMTYLLTFICCYKIKNIIVKEIISITVALFISNCVIFNVDNSGFGTFEIILLVIQLILIIALFICSILDGYSKGKKDILRYRKELDIKRKEAVLKTPPKVKCLIYNCNRLIKKYPKEMAFLQEFGIEFVQEYIIKDKELKRKKQVTQNESDDKGED